MDNRRKEIWFEGSEDLNMALPKLISAIDDIGQYFAGVISLMPGMTSVKLVDQGEDFVTIETNEGIMKRTNISVDSIKDKVSIEFDEEYQAGKTITTNSHFLHEFSSEGDIIKHKMIISGLKAPGFMGFFYRNFGNKSIGKAFLDAHRQYFEK